MIPLLIPRSQRREAILQQALPLMTSRFQIREIDESASTPGDLVFPSLGIACVVGGENVDDIVTRAGKILQRRRCLILVPQEEVWEVQLRMTMEFDFPWGSVLGFQGSNELAEVVLAYVKGITSTFDGE